MLLAGRYTLNATQTVTSAHKAAQLPVDELDVHLEVRSPRIVLPPDQVLSTFPPAESEGAYGSRLPQVVIRRRTLPWERQLTVPPPLTPWLALVVVAEGEATLVPNVPAATTVTAGVTFAGAIDADIGNCLEIRQSMVNTIFPTQLDVPLLAHARQVDINDTELMMGDDDGFLAVVVANRLPLSSRDAAGKETPVKYTVCLVNLEGQWERLLRTAPTPTLFSEFIGPDQRVQISAAAMDLHLMGGNVDITAALTTTVASIAAPLDAAPLGDVHPSEPESREAGTGEGASMSPRYIADVVRDASAGAQTRTNAGFSAPLKAAGPARGGVAHSFTTEGMVTTATFPALDPLLRFPVLLHWRFTTTGTATFELLMSNLDSGLLGTVARTAPASDAGRLPLELVDTGHVGIEQKTRRGDGVRAWYRGPFVPHPTDDTPANRLPLAHAADQLRIVIPDGREDLSLASAFEIGRLLALASPNMIAALLRWRQLHYATVRRTSVWQINATFLNTINGFSIADRVNMSVAVDLSRAIMRSVSSQPAALLGGPRSLVDPGRTVELGAALDGLLADATRTDAAALMSAAFGLPLLRGDAAQVLLTLQNTPVHVAPVTETVGRAPSGGFSTIEKAALSRALDVRVQRLTSLAVVAGSGKTSPIARAPADAASAGAATGRRKGSAKATDALDAVVERVARRARDADDPDHTDTAESDA
jgi:hypothetical protein